MRRPLISLGDALRAVADLEPKDVKARDAIVDMLGLRVEHSTVAPQAIGAWKPSSTASVVTAQREVRKAHRKPFTPPERELLQRPSPKDRKVVKSEVTLVTEGTGTFNAPQWAGQPGEALGPATPSGPPPPTPALFKRLVRRGILSAALGTSVQEGDLDMDRVIDILGNGRPLETLPRLARPSLRRGVQLLLDRSAAMDPFFQDQEQLVQSLDDILADDRLEVLYFAGCPGRGVGSGGPDKWRPWKPPPQGTPVLAVTDLGIGGPVLDDDRAPPTEWLKFANRVRSEGHLLIALVPYEALRWPPAVARALTAIHWSERTTAGEIRHAMRDAWSRSQ